MNGDPYRTPQPADRRVVNRSSQAYRSADEPQPVKEDAPAPTPKTVPRSSGVHHREPAEKKSPKGIILAAIIAVLVVALAVAAFIFFTGNKTGETGINTSRYQAVFLVNGQIYFGKLQDFNDASFKLTDIYYPQAQTAGEGEKTTDQTQSDIQLIKLGDEVHGPESEMFISKDQILYYENLKADSKVAELIKQNGN